MDILQISALLKLKLVERNIYFSNFSKKSFAQADKLKTIPKENAAVVQLCNIAASKL